MIFQEIPEFSRISLISQVFPECCKPCKSNKFVYKFIIFHEDKGKEILKHLRFVKLLVLWALDSRPSTGVYDTLIPQAEFTMPATVQCGLQTQQTSTFISFKVSCFVLYQTHPFISKKSHTYLYCFPIFKFCSILRAVLKKGVQILKMLCVTNWGNL